MSGKWSSQDKASLLSKKNTELPTTETQWAHEMIDSCVDRHKEESCNPSPTEPTVPVAAPSDAAKPTEPVEESTDSR